MIQIPKTGTDGQPMAYYHIISDTDKQQLNRHEFFKLVRATPNGEDRVLPDFDAGVTYFLPDSEHCAEMSRYFCNEADAQRRQNNRHYDCVLKNTMKCDGWKKDTPVEQSCANCNRQHTCRTISLNATFEDDEGYEFEFGDTILDDLSDSLEEIMQNHDDHKILHTALSCLSEEDRRYILTRYGEDMDFVKLAEMYGTNRHYASKRAGRIENRIRKKVGEI